MLQNLCFSKTPITLLKSDDFIKLNNRIYKIYTVLPWKRTTTLLTLQRENHIEQIIVKRKDQILKLIK